MLIRGRAHFRHEKDDLRLGGFNRICGLEWLICRLKSYSQACIFLSFPPPGGGGKKIKGSGDGEGNLRGKKEKKRKFGENITFYSTKS